MSHRFAFSMNGYTRFSPEEAARSIAAIGYTGAELLADQPHFFLSTSKSQEARLIKQVFRDTGLAISNVNANTLKGCGMDPDGFDPSFIHPDPHVRQGRIDYTRRCVEFAAEAGASCISVTSGIRRTVVSEQQAWGWLEDAFGLLLPLAAQHGIQIGVEYEPGLFIEDCRGMEQLFKRISHPNLTANLDLGHADVIREDPTDVIHRLQGKISNIHIEDIKDHVHVHLIPGHGGMDFASILDALTKTNYTRFVTVELYNYESNIEPAAKESLAYLKKLQTPTPKN